MRFKIFLIDFFNVIYRSFFDKNLYRSYLTNGKKNIFRYLFLILLLSFLIPATFVFVRVKNVDFENPNSFTQKLDHIITQIPSLEIKNGKLLYDEKVKVTDPEINKNIIVIDKEAKSYAQENAIMLINENSVSFNNYELLGVLFKYVGILKDLNATKGEKFIALEFQEETNEIITQNRLRDELSTFFHNSAYKIYFTVLPIAILASIAFELLKIVLFSFYTSYLLNKEKIKLKNSKEIFRITAFAFIPSLTIQLVNAASLWSSYLLNAPLFSLVIFLGLKIFYINFVVKSLAEK